MKARVMWVNAFGNVGSQEVDGDAVEAFVDGLHACGATSARIEYPPAPVTFGDIDVGDWFTVGDNEWVKTITNEFFSCHNATAPDGERDYFHDDAIVHPFEWEWVE